MTRGRETSVLEVNKAGLSAEDEKVKSGYGLVSSSYTLEYGPIDLGTHFAKGIVKIVSPVSSKFNPFQKISRRGQETFSKLLGGTKVSLNSEGSPRPVCDSLSEVSSR